MVYVHSSNRPIFLNFLLFETILSIISYAICAVVCEERSVLKARFLFLKNGALLHFITKTYNLLNFLLIQTILFILCYGICTQFKQAYFVEFSIIFETILSIISYAICAVVCEERSVLKARFLFLKNGALLHYITKTYNPLNFLLIQTILFILCYGISTQLFLKSEAFLESQIRFLFLKNEALLHFVTEI